MPMLIIQQPQFYWWPVTYYGSNADDQIVGHSLVHNEIWGGAGNDWLSGNVGGDWIDGGVGNDQIFTYEGNDTAHGNYGDDVVDGGAGNDLLYGDDGYDILFGDAGNDTLTGGNEGDLLIGGEGNDVLYGDAGDDAIYGGSGRDSALGGAGDDFLQVGEDTLSLAAGGDGNDTIVGGDHGNFLLGDAGNDTIWGGAGQDQIWAGSGNDHLFGQGGDDAFIMGSGDSVADGGTGNDSFSFYYADIDSNFTLKGGEGHDTVLFGEGALPGPGSGGSNMLFTPASLALSDLAAKVDSVEVLSLNLQISKLDLHVKPADVLDFTETGVLQLDLNDPVSLHLEGGWTKGATGMVDGFLHTDYVAAVGDHLVKVVVAAPHVDVV